MYLILSIKRHNTNSLLLDVLKVFYALDDDVLWCCGRLSFAKRRESSSRVLHYYVVVRCVCDWNSRPILLFVQLEEGKTLSKRKSPNARIKRGRPKNTPHKNPQSIVSSVERKASTHKIALKSVVLAQRRRRDILIKDQHHVRHILRPFRDWKSKGESRAHVYTVSYTHLRAHET